MDVHLEYKLRLTKDVTHKSLYSWCIQEFDESGNQVGDDNIPWAWSCRFEATEFSYSKSVNNDPYANAEVDGGEVSNIKEDRSTINYTETITARLRPAGHHTVPTYSMLGTSRKIDEFFLDILKSDTEECKVWGAVSSTHEHDFRDQTDPDIIRVSVGIQPDHFADIARQLRSGEASLLRIRLNIVSGFYSRWVPGISTTSIKVLTQSFMREDQEVTLPEGCDIVPPRLGSVAEFDLTVGSIKQLQQANDQRDNNAAWDDDDAFGTSESNEELSNRSLTLDDNSIKLLASKITKALSPQLWLIVLLMLILLFKAS